MKVSVIIPCFNTAKSIRRTMEVFLDQAKGLCDIELILIADASTDHPETQHEDYVRDGKIIFLRNRSQ